MDQVGKNAFELPIELQLITESVILPLILKTVYKFLTRFNIYMHITVEEASKHMLYLPFPKKGK